jgi:hypothetical protein
VSWETILATLGVKRLGEILAPFGVRLCEPMLIRKIAEARVDELRQVTNAISEADKILPGGTVIEYNKEGFSLTTKTHPETPGLLDRTLFRNVVKELNGQICLEGVVAAAIPELEKLTSIPAQKPDPTWTIRFLGYAEGMADPYLQELWGKVLAGEIEQPGSYSLRTLDVLSAMTQKEAEWFVAACKYIVWTPNDLFVPRDIKSFLSGSALTYRGFSELAEIGLFHQDDIALHPFRTGASEVYFGFSDLALAVTKAQTPPRIETGLSVWLVTKSGRDLTRFAIWETPSGYVEKFREGIRKIGWESRIGKIADYSNPVFAEIVVAPTASPLTSRTPPD